jgi:uroporphyrinogen-III decarboxylase
MKYEINVRYPSDEMEKSRKRLEAYGNWTHHDRVPVSFCIVPRYFAKAMGVTYSDIFKSADAQFEFLLQSFKYLAENIKSDMVTVPEIYVHPYFDNVSSASHFGGHVEWLENETLQAVPVIHTIEQMKAFEIPDPEAGLYGTVIKWWGRMKELAEETTVSFNGVPGKVTVSGLNMMALGPHMIAIDLIGEDFYWWCIEEPELCKEFLQKITNGLIEAEEHSRSLDPRTAQYDAFGIAEDSSTIMAADMFREFVIPYDKQLYDRFGKKCRSMHMCGPSEHLHGALVDELGITDFAAFGYQSTPEYTARSMGGRVRLIGNRHPMLMLSGTREEVRGEVMRTLEHLGPLPGYILSDGANVCPGTPVENINALVETAFEYAALHPEIFKV